MIITSNKSFAEWGSVLGDDVLAGEDGAAQAEVEPAHRLRRAVPARHLEQLQRQQRPVHHQAGVALDLRDVRQVVVDAVGVVRRRAEQKQLSAGRVAQRRRQLVANCDLADRSLIAGAVGASRRQRAGAALIQASIAARPAASRCRPSLSDHSIRTAQ